MAIDPYQVPQSETLEKNSAKFPFVRILKNVIYIGIFLMILDVVFRGDDETVKEVVNGLFQKYTTFTGLIPLLIAFIFCSYKEVKEYNTPDSVYENDLDSSKASVVTKALIVLKRRKVDFSPFIPKLLPKLLDNSSVKRSNAYSWIKKYYPEIEREITELKKFKAVSDLDLCRKVVTPLFERYGLNLEDPYKLQLETEPRNDRAEIFEGVKDNLPHSSEIQVPKEPVGKFFRLFSRLFYLMTDLLVLLLWLTGIVFAFFVSGWDLKIVCVIGFFIIGLMFQSLNLSYRVRKLFMRRIAFRNGDVKKCMVGLEKLGTHDNFHLFDDDEGYLFATSDGFKLVTLRGVNCVLEMDAVQFVRISEKNFSCAIDCQNIDGSSMFGFVLNPMYEKWDSDTLSQGTLRFEWFLSYMGIDNRQYKEN